MSSSSRAIDFDGISTCTRFSQNSLAKIKLVNIYTAIFKNNVFSVLYTFIFYVIRTPLLVLCAIRSKNISLLFISSNRADATDFRYSLHNKSTMIELELHVVIEKKNFNFSANSRLISRSVLIYIFSFLYYLGIISTFDSVRQKHFTPSMTFVAIRVFFIPCLHLAVDNINGMLSTTKREYRYHSNEHDVITNE